MCGRDEFEKVIWTLLEQPEEDVGRWLRKCRRAFLRLDLCAMAASLDDRTLLVFHTIKRMVSDIYRNFACDSSFSFPQDGEEGKALRSMCTEITEFANAMRDSDQHPSDGIKRLSQSVREYYNCAALLDEALENEHKEVK